MHVVVTFFSFSKIKNLMYFMGMLWTEAVSREVKWQKGFRLFIEKNFFKERLMSPCVSPGWGFSLSHLWPKDEIGQIPLGRYLGAFVPALRMGVDFFPFQPHFL